MSIEDYKVVEKAGEIGWDIYIRMELLIPFNKYICNKKLTQREIIKLGCDICTALEICEKCNIIHRDIKPENIFINDFGDFKLGDFGIARKLENLTGYLSQKGTYNYMAPEVAKSRDYDSRADIYSLGIVLYRLSNGNRLPFLDSEKQLLDPDERRAAAERRLAGEKLKEPYDASSAMANLILRACLFDPKKRFASAAEMKQALMSVADGTYEMAAFEDEDETTPIDEDETIPINQDKTLPIDEELIQDENTSVHKTAAEDTENSSKNMDTFDKKRKPPKKKRSKKRKFPKIIIAALSIIILVNVGLFFGK